MPTYKFRNKKTGKTKKEFMSISERDKYLSENPDIEQMVYGAPPQADEYKIGRLKPSDGFRGLLKEIKKTTRGRFETNW